MCGRLVERQPNQQSVAGEPKRSANQKFRSANSVSGLPRFAARMPSACLPLGLPATGGSLSDSMRSQTAILTFDW